ncbi:hypothetical protein FOIG_16807 [Fusarium odoratissimum NRRL 54006]|uniref:Uncharacterized protein n=1 Tax=Fusarium odoratissimum (strain NRRL 54006) TaxID=1089451 RepID=X0J0N3_FUSO5|nr:uncharacterized protein FOIG_16807 [Fusarium odoratissimum NRRL 54006]EXL89911.1 hypothetical protein FOIG_16807 [Fusarium odoratissimum NRRL 54006]
MCRKSEATVRWRWPFLKEKRIMGRVPRNRMLWKIRVPWNLLPSKLIPTDETVTAICMRWEGTLTWTWPVPQRQRMMSQGSLD